MATALEIMRQEGLERLSMRRLAADLDTGQASLYVYVANTAELHGALLDELLAELELHRPAQPDTARDTLVDLLCDFTELLMRYPSLARSVLSLWPTGPNYLALIEEIIQLLELGGVESRQAAWGVDVLLQHATASAAEHGTRGESIDADAQSYDLSDAIAEAPERDFPNIARLRGELFSGTGGQRARWQLTALIQGIATTPTPN